MNKKDVDSIDRFLDRVMDVDRHIYMYCIHHIYNTSSTSIYTIYIYIYRLKTGKNRQTERERV